MNTKKDEIVKEILWLVRQLEVNERSKEFSPAGTAIVRQVEQDLVKWTEHCVDFVDKSGVLPFGDECTATEISLVAASIPVLEKLYVGCVDNYRLFAGCEFKSRLDTDNTPPFETVLFWCTPPTIVYQRAAHSYSFRLYAKLLITTKGLLNAKTEGVVSEKV